MCQSHMKAPAGARVGTKTMEATETLASGFRLGRTLRMLLVLKLKVRTRLLLLALRGKQKARMGMQQDAELVLQKDINCCSEKTSGKADCL